VRRHPELVRPDVSLGARSHAPISDVVPAPRPPGVPQPRILLVDDEPKILRFVARGLAAEGFATDLATNGTDALAMAMRSSYDLVVLDLLLPGLTGTEVLRRLLVARPSQPVLVLSCLTETATKVSCLQLGAEDYLAKPFSLAELLARVHVRLRSAARPAPVILSAGSLRLDVVRREADAGAGATPLAEREFMLLRELMLAAGAPVSKERLLLSVWHYDFDPGSNVVDVYVRRLRLKLGSRVIETVRGEGYRVDAG